jgi:hypothetical protein
MNLFLDELSFDMLPTHFIHHLNPDDRRVWQGLDSPKKIQIFLDQTPYSTDHFNRCPLRVLRERKANCFDGALLAAAALQSIGYPPQILDILPEPGTDDDHLLAVFKKNGRFGAVAKSNFACLRSREPVYLTLRELVMSYFDWFYNVAGQKTLRGYSRPLDLSAFDRLNWTWEDSGANAIEKHLYRLKIVPVLTSEMAKNLEPMDDLTYRAGMMGVNPDGLYKPLE